MYISYKEYNFELEKFICSTKHNPKSIIKRITQNMKLVSAHLRDLSPTIHMLLKFDSNLMVRNGGFGGAPSRIFYLIAYNMHPPIVRSWLGKRSAHIECADDGEVLLWGNVPTMSRLKCLEWLQILSGYDGVVHHDGHCIALGIDLAHIHTRDGVGEVP